MTQGWSLKRTRKSSLSILGDSSWRSRWANPKSQPKVGEASADAEIDRLKDLKKSQGADPLALRDRAVDPLVLQGQAVDPLVLQGQAVDPLVLRGQSADPKAPEDQEGDEGVQTRLLTTKAPFSEEDFRDTCQGDPVRSTYMDTVQGLSVLHPRASSALRGGGSSGLRPCHG
jgi:hypothetical protein